ncbi:MAG TPA: translocation/assembly module TamB domain-containing protein [Burkholderiales bacterium]|nr:translocation/assembly module TamB domain-containing protein [Burkholderiales bacterium]
MAALTAAALLGALGAGAWVLGTEEGLRWALARASGATEGRLRVEGARGVLAGIVSVEQLSYEGDGMRLEARSLALSADLLAALAGRLSLAPVTANSLELVLSEKSTTTTAPDGPLPFGISLSDVAVERLAIARNGERHELREIRLQHLQLDRAISAEGSFRRPDEHFPLEASFTVEGSLERFEIDAVLTLAGVPAEGTILIRSSGEPRIESLEARAGPVDLRRFDLALPHTAIKATMQAKGTRDGLAGTLSAANAAHGPLDQDRLPVSRVDTRFATADFVSLALERLLIAVTGGGTLEGTAHVGRQAVRAALRSSGVDLRSLHTKLRRTALNGPLQVTLREDEQSLSATLAQDDVSIEADLTRRGNVVDVHRLRARARGGELAGHATLRLEELHAQGKFDLSRFDPSAFGDYPEGALNASIAASGTAEQMDVAWTLRESTLLGRALASQGSARVAKSRATRVQAEASYGGAQANIRGAFGGVADSMAWSLSVPDLEEFGDQLGGALSARGTLSGDLSDPRATGSAQVENLQLPGAVHLAQASASFEGRLGEHEIALAARASGHAPRARMRGGWHGARGWTGVIVSLSSEGPVPLELVAPASLALSREQVALGRTEVKLGNGRLLVQEMRWQPGGLASRGEFRGLPAEWLVAPTGFAQRVRGDLRLDGEWSLAATPRLNGTLDLRRASGDLAVDGFGLELLQAFLKAKLDDGRASAHGRVDSRFATVSIEGRLAPIPGKEGLGYGEASAISLRASAELADARSLAPAIPPELRVDGRLSVELAVAGTLGAPSPSGKLAGEAIAIQLSEHGVYLRDGELHAVLEDDAVRVTRFSIQSGGAGRLTASGVVPLPGSKHEATLEWQAHQLTAVDRPDMRVVMSGDGAARFDGRRLSLSGDLKVDRGDITLQRESLPKLGDDVVIIGEPPAARAGKAPLPMSLDLTVDLGNALRLETRGYDGRLAGRLQIVTGKEGELRAFGEVRAVNATFLAYGQTLQVDPGVLTFDGPLDNPALQITAWRRNQAVEAGVEITGTAHAPRVQLVSQPPVPEGERLSWLILGRGSGNASQADLGLLQAAAGALISSGESVPIDRRLARSVGLDEVSLRGTGEVEDRVVAFGKRLSDRVYISYERGLGAIATNLVKLDYALGQNWSVRAEAGTNTAGTARSGGGLFYRFSWD